MRLVANPIGHPVAGSNPPASGHGQYLASQHEPRAIEANPHNSRLRRTPRFHIDGELWPAEFDKGCPCGNLEQTALASNLLTYLNSKYRLVHAYNPPTVSSQLPRRESRDWDDRRDPARLHNTKSPEYRLNPESDPEQWRGNEPAPATVPLRGR